MKEAKENLNEAVQEILSAEMKHIRPALSNIEAIIKEQGIRDGFAKEILARNNLHHVLSLLDEVKVLVTTAAKEIE